MGKRSDRRKFRRRRRWAGFILLVSFALFVFGAQFLVGLASPDLQTAASRTAEKVGVQRVESPDVADAPEAVGKETADEVALLASEEEDVKTPAEKAKVDKEAAQTADEKKEAAKQQEQRSQKQDDPQQASVPDPKTDDLWFSIPALGLWDQYVTNTNDFSAMDYGAIKLPNSGYPWQKGANTYIAAHRLGWPGTGSYHQFYDLPALQLGDIVYLGDANGTTYTYKVTAFKEIAPNQAAEVTGPQNGRDMVSLQTCIENYGDYWTMGPNWYVRYIVQADRVSVTPAK
jgi:sortase A